MYTYLRQSALHTTHFLVFFACTCTTRVSPTFVCQVCCLLIGVLPIWFSFATKWALVLILVVMEAERMRVVSNMFFPPPQKHGT